MRGAGWPCGVLLDPPYGLGNLEYGEGGMGHGIADEVREWAVANGDDKRLRIALCGFEGQHAMPATWRKVAWKSNGGYGSHGGGESNQHSERIWFSPHCEEPPMRTLFDEPTP